MNVRLEAGQFGWDYLLVFSDGKEFLVQTDHDYPEAATMFGFADSPDEYLTAGEYYNAASDWLDQHIGETHPVHPEAPLHLRASATEVAQREPRASRDEAQFIPVTEADVDITIDVLPEDLSVPTEEDWGDEEYRREIRRRLARGDHWAWGVAKVTAAYGGEEAVEYLGGCSYRDSEDFRRNSGYYEDMKREAVAKLNRKLEEEFNRQRAAISRRVGARQQFSSLGDRAWHATPLIIKFTDSGMRVKHDGSLDQDEVERITRRTPEANALAEVFENAVINGLLYWVNPEEIGVLTDAPMLARQDECERDETMVLTRCDAVYVWLNYQISSLVDTIFHHAEGAFMGRQFTNWTPLVSSREEERMEEVVKEGRFPLEGEWEKDER